MFMSALNAFRSYLLLATQPLYQKNTHDSSFCWWGLVDSEKIDGLTARVSSDAIFRFAMTELPVLAAMKFRQSHWIPYLSVDIPPMQRVPGPLRKVKNSVYPKYPSFNAYTWQRDALAPAFERALPHHSPSIATNMQHNDASTPPSSGSIAQIPKLLIKKITTGYRVSVKKKPPKNSVEPEESLTTANDPYGPMKHLTTWDDSTLSLPEGGDTVKARSHKHKGPDLQDNEGVGWRRRLRPRK